MAKKKTRKTTTVKKGGAGTAIAKVAKKTGVKKLVEVFAKGKDCGCDKREEKINKLLPARYKANCLTEEQYNQWQEFKKTRTLKRIIHWDQVLYICKTYSDVFNRQYWKPECVNCTGTMNTLLRMVDFIDLVSDVYEEDIKKSNKDS